MTEPEASARVASISLKFPPFWPADPQIWFAQVEAQFSTRGVTLQKTMFDYIVASLSPEFATEVPDLILKPPTENPYDKLKEQLIKRTAASEQRRLQQLFNSEELGDQKPTQLLRRMQQLLGDTPGITDGSFIRKLFLRLTANVRMVLASTNDSVSLDDLAQLADKIVEVSAPQSVSTVRSSNLSDEVEKLKGQLTNLTQLVKSLSFQRKSRTRSPSPAPPDSSNANDTTVCWYHQKYGQSAHKCKSPCTYSRKSLAAMNSSGQKQGHLFHFVDKSSGLHFLVDTGAEVSVIPPSQTDRKCPQQNFTLQAVNNTSITTYGSRSLTLNLGLRRTFHWIFIITDVQHPILGADFLRNYSLLVDMSHNRVLDSLTQLKVQGIVTQESSPSPTLPTAQSTNEFAAILSNFPDVTKPHYGNYPIKHYITHHIATTGPPVSAHP